MPSSRIARDFTRPNPACDQSTDERMIENGSARTTLVGCDLLVEPPCLKVSRYVPSALRADRDELAPERDLAAEGRVSSAGDLIVAAAHVVLLVRLAEDPHLARPRVAEQVEHVQRALLAGLGAVLDVVGDVEQLTELRADPAGT